MAKYFSLRNGKENMNRAIQSFNINLLINELMEFM